MSFVCLFARIFSDAVYVCSSFLLHGHVVYLALTLIVVAGFCSYSYATCKYVQCLYKMCKANAVIPCAWMHYFLAPCTNGHFHVNLICKHHLFATYSWQKASTWLVPATLCTKTDDVRGRTRAASKWWFQRRACARAISLWFNQSGAAKEDQLNVLAIF